MAWCNNLDNNRRRLLYFFNIDKVLPLHTWLAQTTIEQRLKYLGVQKRNDYPETSANEADKTGSSSGEDENKHIWIYKISQK